MVNNSQAMIRDGYIQSLVPRVDEIHDSFVRPMLKMADRKGDYAGMRQHGLYKLPFVLLSMVAVGS